MVQLASSPQHTNVHKKMLTISYSETPSFGHTLEGPLTPYDLQLLHHQTRHHTAT